MYALVMRRRRADLMYSGVMIPLRMPSALTRWRRMPALRIRAQFASSRNRVALWAPIRRHSVLADCLRDT